MGIKYRTLPPVDISFDFGKVEERIAGTFGIPPMKLRNGRAVAVVCECGGAKASTSHSHWCPVAVHWSPPPEPVTPNFRTGNDEREEDW